MDDIQARIIEAIKNDPFLKPDNPNESYKVGLPWITELFSEEERKDALGDSLDAWEDVQLERTGLDAVLIIPAKYFKD